MIILDADAKTSPAHGCIPSERSIEQLLEGGMVVIAGWFVDNNHPSLE